MVTEQRKIEDEDGCRHSGAISLLYYCAPNKNKDSPTCAQTGTESSPFQVPKRGFNSFPIHPRDSMLDACLSLLFTLFSSSCLCYCDTGVRGYGAGGVLPSLFITQCFLPGWTDYITMGKVYQRRLLKKITRCRSALKKKNARVYSASEWIDKLTDAVLYRYLLSSAKEIKINQGNKTSPLCNP